MMADGGQMWMDIGMMEEYVRGVWGRYGFRYMVCSSIYTRWLMSLPEFVKESIGIAPSMGEKWN